MQSVKTLAKHQVHHQGVVFRSGIAVRGVLDEGQSQAAGWPKP
jgi:hypothetical protein